MTLVIRRSKIHADGCYTTEPIKKKGFVAEYSGPRITIAEADALYEHSPRTYLFGLINGTHVIDGDSASAFINHSCDPNCEADEIDGKVIITAVRKIEAGEELTYDYNLYDGDLEDESPCFCGMKLCRGSMYSEKELEKRAKSKREAKAGQGTPSAKAEPSAAGTENIKARQSTRKRS
jgi:SET domain-containing protein